MYASRREKQSVMASNEENKPNEGVLTTAAKAIGEATHTVASWVGLAGEPSGESKSTAPTPAEEKKSMRPGTPNKKAPSKKAAKKSPAKKAPAKKGAAKKAAAKKSAANRGAAKKAAAKKAPAKKASAKKATAKKKTTKKAKRTK
jgi:hypothetical protein